MRQVAALFATLPTACLLASQLRHPTVSVKIIWPTGQSELLLKTQLKMKYYDVWQHLLQVGAVKKVRKQGQGRY
jgi:hypothetical protein